MELVNKRKKRGIYKVKTVKKKGQKTSPVFRSVPSKSRITWETILPNGLVAAIMSSLDSGKIILPNKYYLQRTLQRHLQKT